MISKLPVVIRRLVRFGDCDPAGVVYTPVFSDYALSAYQWLMTVLLGGPMYREMLRVGFDSPIKALTFEFRNMLQVEQMFDMTCLVTDIRNRTFDVEITGRSTTAIPHDIFVAKVSPIMVARDERKSSPIPSGLRDSLENYRARTQNSGTLRSSAGSA